MCVLLVDDDAIFHLIFKKIFKFHDICDDVETVNNGSEAIQRLTQIEQEQNNFLKAILVDLNMPIMNGWEFLDEFEKKLKFKFPNVDIWMVTSSINPEDQEKAESYSFINGFIQKPFTKPDIETFKQYIHKN